MLNVSLRQLQVFVHVARHGTVRHAAELMHLTQPATSMALSEMERQLSGPLFHREHGRLQLNDLGRELLPLAEELLERFEEFSQVAEGGQRNLNGELRIGASNTVGNYRVGELCGDFARLNPQVSIRLKVANTQEIAAALLERELDVGCVEGPVTHPQLDVRPWRDDDMVICASPSDVLADRKNSLAPEDFAGARWVLREPGSATRAFTERLMAELPIGHTVIELDQSEAVKHSIIAGLGIGCLPVVAIQDALATGRLVVLPTPFLHLTRKLSIIVARTGYQSAMLRAFLMTVGEQ